jgi:tetratricopeptide (TPR) repeat protein
VFSGSWSRFFVFPSKSLEARFGAWLAGLCLAAGVARLAVLIEFLAENPFAWLPRSDGGLYWKQAGELAAGIGWGETPFLIAPLYPLLLAGLRWAGGDLVTLYSLQLAVHLATAVLLAQATRLRFGAGAGLLAAGLFLGLAEPALFATRVLSVTLQLFWVALLYWDWTRLSQADPPTPGHVARVGAWVGALALAYPAALLLVPAYGAWLAWSAASPASRRALSAVTGVGCAAAVIAPATLHNAWVTGELIPITAHAGITLRQGNGPGSVGIYTPVDGIGVAITDQHRDAARLFRKLHGRDGSWGEIDASFRHEVVRWWLAHPFEATSLFARKLYWTLTSRDYDNVTAFALEREHGLADRAFLVPLEVPWLMGVAALGLTLACRRPARFAPELLLLGLPVLVCVGFYYSARYRLVAAPLLCALAAGAAVHWRELGWPRGAVAALALAPLPLLVANAFTGFGSLDFMRAPFARSLAASQVRLGRRLWADGDPAAAAERFRRALEADPSYAPARTALDQTLYNAAVAQGDFASALRRLESLAAEAPDDAQTRLALAWLLATCPDAALRSGEAALRHAREAERVAGEGSPDVQLALAVARAENGDFEGAVQAARRGADLLREGGRPDAAGEFEALASQLAARRPVRGEPRWLRVALASGAVADHSI